MATFPTSADFRREAPRTTAGNYRVGRAPDLGTEDAQTLYEQGQQSRQLARDVEALGTQLDTAAAQEAVNKLRAMRQELTYDPEKGFRRIKGGDVLKPGADGKPLLEGLPASFKAASDEISGKLISPGAKAMFAQIASGEERQYRHDLAVYFSGQAEQFETASYKDGVNLDLAEAAQAFNDPAKLAAIATRAERRARTFATHRGMPGDSTAMAVRSNVYRTGVEALLASGDNRRALTFYDGIKDKLDGQDATVLQARLKSTATEVESEDVVQSYRGVAIPDRVKQYDPLIQQASSKHGVSPALVTAVMSQESQGNSRAVSSAGAGGLMQLMPGTAKDLGVANVFDEGQNVDGGTRYLKQMLTKYNGNERLALMAYNWGPGSVDNWLAKGANPDEIPAETRNYVQKVKGYQASIGGKSDVKTAQLDILSRTDLPKAVKAGAYALMEKESAAFEAYKTAELKTLEDNLKATLATAMLAPDTYKDGTLLAYADKFQALGRSEEAVRLRVLASQEGTLKTFATSATEAQRSFISELLKGLPKDIADAIMKGDKGGRSEALKRGNEAFTVLQKAQGDNVAPEGLRKQAGEAIQFFNAAGDAEGARKVAEFYETAVKSHAIAQENPARADQLIGEVKAEADSGKGTQQDLQLLDLAGETMRRQAAAFDKDAFGTGTSLYKEVGQPVPINWADQTDSIVAGLRMRWQQAQQISARRGGIPVLPFSQPELDQLRQTLDAAPPDQQARIMKTLALSPPEALPGIAAALAGKKDAGDPLSRSYAAAMSFFAEGNTDVGDQVLKGSQIMRSQGDSGRKPAATSDAWQTGLQDRVGNVFRDLGAKVPAVVADAIASVYVYQMARAGKQGEKTDTDVLDKAITAVLGQPLERNGQRFLPPARGMTDYEFDNVLGRLTDGDTANLRTVEGDAVTADVIRRRGVLSNVADGLYMVRIPDPRRRGDLSEILDPSTGRAWLLDGKALMQRTPPAPFRDPNAPDYIQAPPLARP